MPAHAAGIHFRYDLHFWLGDNSSADERGTAAILSIKIDDALGGYPVQYRELQGFETPTFMGYFKNGVKYQVICFCVSFVVLF